MSILRILTVLFFPPIAVVDKGLGNFLIVLICWLFWHIPGTIVALFILTNEQKEKNRYVSIS